MKCVNGRGFFRVIILALALMLLAACGAGLCEEAAPEHNYILVIDNSRSTTGRHSLGQATDPRGLRFDAARLVYQNVVSSGRGGQIGVIVFCGPKNCVTYGPMDIQSPELDAVIGDNLNAEANQKRRDDFTDIRTALETARNMMTDFGGRTSVILLTDGVNDLTNRSDPFNRPENTEANDQSVEIVEAISAAGADFHVIALTTKEDVSADDPFMAFINRLAAAGGGRETADDVYDNVLVTTQSDLNSSLLQMLIKAESESETIQTIAEYTPVHQPFTVPYAGISDATVNITFMPEDKQNLEKVELVSPDGAARTLWEGGAAREQDGITVTEDRSYIMLAIPSPQPGDWNVVITGKKDADGNSGVPTNAVVRFNHNLRLALDAPETVYLDEAMTIAAWFQGFDGAGFRDLTDSAIYDQSEAKITIITPEEKKWSGAMKRKGDRYEVSVAPKILGTWRVYVRVSNPHLQENSEEVRFTVLERPTPEPTAIPTPTPVPTPTPEPTSAPDETQAGAVPEPTGALAEATPTPEPTATPTPTLTPTPTPTPIPTVKPMAPLKLRIVPLVMRSDGNYIHRNGKRIRVNWKADADAEFISAELLENGAFLRDLESGDRIDPTRLRDDAEYEVRVSAMPQFGMMNDIEPYTESIRFKLLPEVSEVKGISLFVDPMVDGPDGTPCLDRDAERYTLSWTVDGETESEQATLLEDGRAIREVYSGEEIERALFKDDAEYTLSVSVMPKNGASQGVKSVKKATSFRLYPAAEPIVGLTLEVPAGSLQDGVYQLKGSAADLNWHIDSGDVERYELTISGVDGVVQKYLDGTSYRFSAHKPGDYAVVLVAVPRYARNGEGSASAKAMIRPHIAGVIERYWPYGLAALVLIIIAIVALLLLRSARALHVVGSLRVVCEALELDQLLVFTDDRKGVRPDSSLTAHRALAGLKGKRAYALLSRIKVSNALANNLGRAHCKLEDPEVVERVRAVQHRPNEHLIALSYTDPKRGIRDACCVGRFDIGESGFTMTDDAGEVRFVFTGR